MEGEHVDRAPLAAHVERHLDRALPARGAEPFHDSIDERSVTRVEQSIERLAVPAQARLEPSSEAARDPGQRREPKGIDLAAFGSAHLGTTRPSPLRHVVLRETLALPQGPELPAEPDHVHPRRMDASAQRPLTAMVRLRTTDRGTTCCIGSDASN